MSSIFYQQFGTQGPPIVVIHGLFGSLENLGVICRQLSDEYSVYALDLPNHGRSAHCASVSLATMAESVVEWMAGIGLDKACFLGHSLGGKVSMEIALRYPDKVDRLVVADISPVAYARRHDEIFAAFKAVDLTTIKSRTEADQLMQAYVDEASTRSFLLKNLELHEQGWRWRLNVDGLLNAYDELVAANTTDCPAFLGPVLFIKGELSPYMLAEHRECILSLFPKAGVKVMNGTQHWLHAEKPDIFSGIVRRFLSAA